METFPAFVALCEGTSPVTVEFPSQDQWREPEQRVEQTIETPVIWDAISLIMTSPCMRQNRLSFSTRSEK